MMAVTLSGAVRGLLFQQHLISGVTKNRHTTDVVRECVCRPEPAAGVEVEDRTPHKLRLASNTWHLCQSWQCCQMPKICLTA